MFTGTETFFWQLPSISVCNKTSDQNENPVLGVLVHLIEVIVGVYRFQWCLSRLAPIRTYLRLLAVQSGNVITRPECIVWDLILWSSLVDSLVSPFLPKMEIYLPLRSFWLRFWQIDVARLWNLVCLSPSWQYSHVYDLPALESSDGFTNAQCTLSLVFVFCCVPNHSAFMNIVETILNICLHNSLMLHSLGLALPSWHFPNTPVLAQSRLWWMLSNWAQWHFNLDHLPNGWVCFCHRALEYR